jgi:L-fuconolactonase
MIIDAHHHLWTYDPVRYPWMTEDWAPIRRNFTPEDLGPLLRAAGVERTVLVQACSSRAETREFLEAAARTPFVAGVVGWADLTAGGTAETIASLKAMTGGHKLVGIRHQVHDEDDPAWLLRSDVQRSLQAVGQAGLAFDLLVRTRELPAAHETALRHPGIRFVIDHMAKPPIQQGGSPDWDTWMARMAALPNVSCKLSGLVTEADWKGWSAAVLKPYVERALGWFGAERLLFGSDWPVCLVAASYSQVVELARELVRDLPPSQRVAILGGNAAAVYGLSRLDTSHTGS